jgi:hypothetical protein
MVWVTEFNIILQTWSDIVSDQPNVLVGRLIILKRDVASCHNITINENRNNYQKSKNMAYE